jgi:hypothetical protein
VPKRLFRPPDHLIKQWPEVFEDMYMNTMPLLYLNSVQIEFKDGRIWEIDVKTQLLNIDADTVADKILDIFEEYNKEIQEINFDVDTDKLKQDISNQTKGMLG